MTANVRNTANGYPAQINHPMTYFANAATDDHDMTHAVHVKITEDGGCLTACGREWHRSTGGFSDVWTRREPFGQLARFPSSDTQKPTLSCPVCMAMDNNQWGHTEHADPAMVPVSVPTPTVQTTDRLDALKSINENINARRSAQQYQRGVQSATTLVLEALTSVHKPRLFTTGNDPYEWCVHCREQYPCSTVRVVRDALDQAAIDTTFTKDGDR